MRTIGVTPLVLVFLYFTRLYRTWTGQGQASLPEVVAALAAAAAAVEEEEARSRLAKAEPAAIARLWCTLAQ
jgi:hypothetical protein